MVLLLLLLLPCTQRLGGPEQLQLPANAAQPDGTI
jgi:hypothetical protein